MPASQRSTGAPAEDDQDDKEEKSEALHHAEGVGVEDAVLGRAEALAGSVRSQANVLAYIDGFMIIGFAAIGALLLMLLLRAPPAQPKPPARAGTPA